MLLNDEFVDPQMAGLAAAGGILGQLSMPSARPVGLGSILGQAGAAAAQARNQAAFQQEQLANQRMLRQAQAEEMRERAGARKAALQKQMQDAQAQVTFRQLLAESDNPSDPINVLGAGMRSGALDATKYSQLLATVQEKQAAREQRIQELQLRLADQKLAREDRENFTREMEAARRSHHQDMTRLAAALRPVPQGDIKQLEDGSYARFTPDNRVIPITLNNGMPARGKTPQDKPPSGYRWKEGQPGVLEPIPGGPATFATPEQAAKIELLENGKKDIQRFRDLVMKDGKPDRKILTMMHVPGGGAPGTDARMAYSYIYNAVEAKLRAESGAAVPETEVRRMAARFIPGPLDNDATVADRIDRLEEFLGGAKSRTKGHEGGEPPAATKKPWERDR